MLVTMTKAAGVSLIGCSTGAWKFANYKMCIRDRFLTSQCITLFGSTLVQLALVWYAAMETSSGSWVAAFTVCAYLPQFLISFLGGVWACLLYTSRCV